MPAYCQALTVAVCVPYYIRNEVIIHKKPEEMKREQVTRYIRSKPSTAELDKTKITENGHGIHSKEVTLKWDQRYVDTQMAKETSCPIYKTFTLHCLPCQDIKISRQKQKRYNTRRLLLSHPKTKRVSLSPFMKGCQDNMVQKMCKEGGLRLCALNVTLIYKKHLYTSLDLWFSFLFLQV